MIEHFDVCGILGVKKESRLAELAKVLKKNTGKDWRYIYGIHTDRPSGLYHEDYAVVW